MARNKKRKGDPVHGWLNFNKPVEMTSTQAVAIVKRLFNAQKAGHGGTLDPLADGVLPIALGEATKTSAYAMDADKDYTFVISWGQSTSTQDREGEVTGSSDVRVPLDAVAEALAGFVGEIEQVPPKFSAIKVNGQRAYDLARDGEEVELKSRTVMLYEAKLDEASTTDEAVIHVTCGKGFYIRALVRDLAFELGMEGHVTSLKRTRVGGFELAQGSSKEEIEALEDPEARKALLVPIEASLDDIPAINISSDGEAKLRNGNEFRLLPHEMQDFQSQRSELQGDESDDRMALAMSNGQALAMGEIRAGFFRPFRVFQIG
ncbi:tRNA pseudouridine(55) synthase TruB [Ponticaulis sp.]|uniref:tRNA pseudouridine(55) synthase TruB n=1 Tax=Ponticaulis sp. TaxID=2020902 RepID=UPI000B656FBE|nr:tRNA pseudouridine(55) synthase TruB [Ponticaulis sp.]MAI91140.1 tRNA pseudouridine(55) synthase TruB [Ponticaulis sp.]OUX98455.1 MAG: tRNA pseudouridine(55) synthase TruB [Hyphomonadaceae bacterium TMED5]